MRRLGVDFVKKLLIVASYLGFFVLGGLTFTHLTTTEAVSSLKKINVFKKQLIIM